MKKLLAPLLLLLSPTLFIAACKAQQQQDDKTLLWRISGNGLAKPSYLFGTIHMLCPDDYLWTDAMKKSLATCSKVCFELDMDDPSVLTSAGAGLMDTSGKALRDYFLPEQYERLRRFVHDSLDADLSQMQMMKPFVLQALLLSKMVSCSFPVSYEANIMEEAAKAKKEIIGLEAVQEQLAVLSEVSDDSATAQLMQMVDSFAAGKREYAQMLASYKAQNLPALYELVRNSKELGDDMGAFLDDRNKKWIPRMAKQMKAAAVFFAVGAAHLYGPEGVISLLRKAGYSVTPVH